MIQTPNDPRVAVTSGGTFCLFDDAGHLIGTIMRPVERHPLGAGREKVYLARPELTQSRSAA
jgi:hypothetical protein